jgi:hypothetical protein
MATVLNAPSSSFNMESDISQLEAPTFSTLERNVPAPMLALDWDHKVNLVGKKVLNPMIHCCDLCLKPILIYGRMIPCKHVFCLGCAKQEDKQCSRCKDKVTRVEQAGLGSIFLCTQGGSRYGNSGCRRTYLSSRDLNAHMTHRHSKPGKEENKIGEKKEVSNNEAIRNAVNSLSKASLAAAVAAASSINPASAAPYSTAAPPQYTPPPAGQYRNAAGNHIAVINTRQSNLITIPIQGEGGGAGDGGGTPPVHPAYPAYPGYTGYSAQPTAAQPTPAAYPQGTSVPGYHQPPPTYAYPGSYSSAPPPQSAQQYSQPSAPQQQYTNSSAAPAPYGQPSAAQPPYSPASAPHSYPPGGYSGAPPFQGQWTRPPPGGARPPPSGTRPPPGGVRPPPSSANQQNYYNRR